MKKISFYIILNVINLFLFWYMYESLELCILLLANDTSSKLSLLGLCIYLLYILSKIILLPLIFAILGSIIKLSIIRTCVYELKNNKQSRNFAILNAFVYDILIIIFLILGTIKDLYFETIAIPFFYELTTMGGICLFYILLFLIWKYQGKLK